MELDFLYVPSVNVAADAADWVNVLGARLVFAVDLPGRLVGQEDGRLVGNGHREARPGRLAPRELAR